MALATVTTRALSVNRNSALVSSNMPSNGGNTVTEYGVVYGTAINPTTSDGKVSTVGAISNGATYQNTITGLTPNATYHVRAFITNSSGTAYSADMIVYTSMDIVISGVNESDWRFIICDENNIKIAILNTCRARKASKALNKAGEASFTINVNELNQIANKIGENPKSLLGAGRHRLNCYRNGVLWFSGQIVKAKLTTNSLDTVVEVTALGWLWLLGFRYISKGVDTELVGNGTALAQYAVDTVQAELYGDFGIIEGSTPASPSITTTVNTQNVLEFIEDIGNADNGFDFEVTPDKVFNKYYPAKGSDLSQDIVLRYPSKVVEQIEEFYDATDLANSVTAIGAGSGLAGVTATRDNFDSQQAFVKREKIVSVKNLDNATVVGDIAQQTLNETAYIAPLYRISLYGNQTVVDINSFDTGDLIKVESKQLGAEIDQALRVFQIDVSISETDLENIALTVGLI